MRPCTLHCQVPQAGMERSAQVLEWLGCQKPNGHSLDLQNQSAWKNVWGSWHSTCFSLKHVHINPSSVIVSHFLDTSMIVQVESIRHLSYCLQAESCKWQVQPSPLLLGRESRHGFKTDIGVEMILDGQRWSLLFFFFHFFHLVTSGQRQHGLGRTEFLNIRRCGPSLMILGCDGGAWHADGDFDRVGLYWIYLTMNMNIYFWEPG